VGSPEMMSWNAFIMPSDNSFNAFSPLTSYWLKVSINCKGRFGYSGILSGILCR
jgi:hypothetical protein